MAKGTSGDQKTARKKAAKGKQPGAESEEPKVLSLTKEGASKPVALVQRAYEASAQFLREVRTELKKVTWPSRKETLASTGVVLIVVFLVGIYLGLVDLALSRLISTVLR